MSDKITSLRQKLYNTPHLMTSELFDSVENFTSTIDATQEIEASLGESCYKSEIEDLQYNEDTGVGILPVVGLITYDESYWWMDTTSYKSLLDDAKTMLEAGAHTIVLDVDSGGGRAYSMIESTSLLRSMMDEYGAKLIAYNDGLAASAAYGISAVAHEVISNPDAQSGSIGVVVSLTSYGEAYKKAGIKKTFITAGGGKVPLDADGDFTKEFLDDIQSKVDKLYERFTSHVAQYRSIDQDAVKALGAKVYTADEAIANGLVDKIMTREEFFNYLAEVSSDKGENNNMIGKFLNKSKEKVVEMSQEQTVELQALQASLEAAVADFSAKLAKTEADFASKFALQDAQLSAKEAELAVAQAAIVEKEKAEKEAKASARVAELSTFVGDVVAPQLAASLEGLSDEQFASTVSVLKLSSKAADESVLMAELGDDGQEVVTEKDASASTIASGMEAYLKQKYSK